MIHQVDQHHAIGGFYNCQFGEGAQSRNVLKGHVRTPIESSHYARIRSNQANIGPCIAGRNKNLIIGTASQERCKGMTEGDLPNRGQATGDPDHIGFLNPAVEQLFRVGLFHFLVSAAENANA